MKKELIIIVFKLNVKGCSNSEINQILTENKIKNSLTKDKDIKEHYIIKEFWLPIIEGTSDIKVIYPVPEYFTSQEINKLIVEISLKIKEDPNNELKNYWEKLVRELKIKKLNEQTNNKVDWF